VSVDPEIIVDGSYPQKAAPLHGPDFTRKQTTPGGGVAASAKPGDSGVDGDLGFHKYVSSGGSQTTSVQLTVQHVGVRGSTGLILPDRVPALLPQSTPLPAISTGSAPPLFHNQPTYLSQYARPPHLRERSMVCFAGFIFVSLHEVIDYGFFFVADTRMKIGIVKSAC
jgi:hypothetical protein